MTKTTNPEAVTLDSIAQALDEWRANKHLSKQRAIPDETWQKIFSMENKHTAVALRAIFKLNSQQYEKKRQELISSDEKTPQIEATAKQPISLPSKDIAFAEVKIADTTISALSENARLNSQTIKNIKNTKIEHEEFLDNNTVIVECIRGDGNKLKIHTTCQKIGDILNSFFC